MPANWKEELFLCLCMVGSVSVAGALLGWPLQGLILGLLAYLGWHIYHVSYFPDWLDGESDKPPVTAGLWRSVQDEILRMETERGAHEHALADSLRRFRAAVTALPDAVIILNQHGFVEWSNPAAHALLDIAPDESAEKQLAKQLREPLLDEYLAAGDFDLPLLFAPPGDRTKVLSLVVTALQDQQRQMLVVSDITRLHHLGETKRDFVANVSHELRTPLTVISGLLEQAAISELDAATQKRVIDMMQQQAARMRDLIDDLLTLSRLEAKDSVPRDQPVAVPGLLQDIVDESRPLSRASGHVIQLDIQSSAGLRGNATELRAAFSNLVNNAIKHTPRRSEIHISWRVDSDGAHLSVRDTGGGIPARHIPRLTERLYRVDSSRSRDTGGIGLGLAIVKHALDRHGARLEISSTEGRGSTFSCHFPPSRIVDTAAPGRAPST